MSDGIQRKLAAILAADVVGYSRLMGEDESATLAALRRFRSKVFTPIVDAHAGSIIKSMGDGWLVTFESAADAVSCAIAIQQKLTGDGIIELRTAVHVGDLTHEDEDVYGDGVNIAARLQDLADPGAIVISETARRSIDGNLAAGFADLGKQELKNIAEPVVAFGWGMSEIARNAPVSPVADKTSIAVLPFNNMSGDPEQEYFADGMSEDIITDLSKISSLFVIARNSSFVYKGRSVDIPSVARELGVRHVLEGSVRRGGDRVRINAQLIDAETGGHLWAERYDRDLTDIFAVQDEVTANIVEALKLTLGEDEERRVHLKGTDNLAAYELMLRGRELFLRVNREDCGKAREVLEQAIELDPGFGPAYGYLAQIHAIEYLNGWSDDPQASLRQAHDLGRRGVECTPEDAHVHIAFGSSYLWLGRHDDAIAEARRAIELDPNYAYAYFELGWYLQYAGRAAEALEYFDRAIVLDPHHADQFLHFMAQAYFQLERYDEAVDILKRRLVRNPRSDGSRMLLASCYGHQGRLEEARNVWAEIMGINPDFSLAQRRAVLPYKRSQDFEQIVEGLRKAGIAAD
jgi:TolB-like protein/Tfp pilus assembly protein PilF